MVIIYVQIVASYGIMITTNKKTQEKRTSSMLTPRHIIEMSTTVETHSICLFELDLREIPNLSTMSNDYMYFQSKWYTKLCDTHLMVADSFNFLGETSKSEIEYKVAMRYNDLAKIYFNAHQLSLDNDETIVITSVSEPTHCSAKSFLNSRYGKFGQSFQMGKSSQNQPIQVSIFECDNCLY